MPVPAAAALSLLTGQPAHRSIIAAYRGAAVMTCCCRPPKGCVDAGSNGTVGQLRDAGFGWDLPCDDGTTYRSGTHPPSRSGPPFRYE